MKERPILFSAPMVRAILAGTKTQTRRAVKGMALEWLTPGMFTPEYVANPENGMCPYGQPGDRLWVRESFRPIASGEVKDGYGEVRYGYAYRADSATRWNERTTIIHDLTGQPATGPMQFNPVPWKPSIHMPRRASRILLEVVSVRIERLHDISEADAQAEGCQLECMTPIGDDSGSAIHGPGGYIALWEQINGADSWQKNPWLWVVEFRVVKQ